MIKEKKKQNYLKKIHQLYATIFKPPPEKISGYTTDDILRVSQRHPQRIVTSDNGMMGIY
jgi:hypothetical protein